MIPDSIEHRLLRAKASILLSQYEDVLKEEREVPQDCYNALRSLADLYGNMWATNQAQVDLLEKRYKIANTRLIEHEATLRDERNQRSKLYRLSD